MRHYCTYFDQNYVPRGLVLLSSMFEHCGRFRLHVLCLDDATFNIVSQLAHGEVTPMRLADLEAADTELAAVKPTRSTIEYYFTLSSVWPRHLLRNHPDIDFLTYIDSDMCFYSSPEPVFAGIGEASVAITPHRFSQENLVLARNGKYNVGWMGFRHDAAGLACLEWYRERCLEWCYDRLEGDRFADQKYLERFPELFPNVVEVAHKGVNVATYNVNGFRITEENGGIMVDDVPLVCYHFHRVREDASGGFRYSLDGPAADDDSVVCRVVYAGYIRRLMEMVEKIRPFFPEAQLSGSVRDSPAHSTWEYRPQGWTEGDRTLTGRDVESVIAARRRDWPAVMAPLLSSAPFGEGRDHDDVMSFAYALGLAARGRERLSVLDWGGALGAGYMTACALYPDLTLEYCCRASPSAAVAGRELNPEVRFAATDAEALDRRYDFVVASSVIQYEKDWRDLVARLARVTAGYLFVARTPVVWQAPSFVVVQRVPGYGTACQGWFLNRDELLEAFSAAGLELVREFAVLETVPVPDAPETGRGRGFLLRPQA